MPIVITNKHQQSGRHSLLWRHHSYLPHSHTCKFSPPRIGGRGGSGIITHATKEFLNNGNCCNYETSFTLAIQGLTGFAEPSSHVNDVYASLKQEGFVTPRGLNNDIGDDFDDNINGQAGGNRGAGCGTSGSSSYGGGNGGTGGGDGMEEWEWEWNWGWTCNNILFAIATSLFRSIWEFGGPEMKVEFLGLVVTGIIYMMEPIIEES